MTIRVPQTDRLVWRTLKLPAFAVLVAALAAWVIVAGEGGVDPLSHDRPYLSHADALVVFGETRPGSCLLDPASQHAVMRAAELSRSGTVDTVVFSGGRQAQTECPAAEAMQTVGTQAGIPANRIRTQPFYTHTESEPERVDAILRTLGVRTLMVFTSARNSAQYRLALQQLGYDVDVMTNESTPPPNRGVRAMTRLDAKLARLRAGPRPARRSFVTAPAQLSSVRAPMHAGPIVIFGTSDVANWDLSELNIPVLLNKGHSGDQTDDLLSRFDRDVMTQHPAAVVLWGFENDFFNVPDEGYAAAMARFERNYSAMVERSLGHGVQPILATEITDGHRSGLVGSLRWTFDRFLNRSLYEDRLNKQILDGNDWLRELGRRNSLLVLDFQPVISNSDQYRLPPFKAPDGSHVSRAGYQALARYTRPLLLEHLRSVFASFNGGAD